MALSPICVPYVGMTANQAIIFSFIANSIKDFGVFSPRHWILLGDADVPLGFGIPMEWWMIWL